VLVAALLGLAFGIPAALTPMRLLALVAATGRREGMRAALAVTLGSVAAEALFAAIAIALLTEFSDGGLGIVGLLGALTLLRLGWAAWSHARTTDPDREVDQIGPARRRRHVRRGAFATVIAPTRSLLWLAVGSPLALRLHLDEGIAGVTVFVAVALVSLTAGRATLAFVAGPAGRRIGGRTYRCAAAMAAVLTAALAVALLVETARTVF
jgi:threonine/homoserine/homoserine lactone efflux protein